MSEKSKTKIDRKELIRYSQCWEDADLLLSALKGSVPRRILSIASAGDNTLSLLCHSPETVQEIIAIDFSSAQLSLLELKMACFRTLSWQETLQFLGAGQKKHSLLLERHQRRKLYRRLRPSLSLSCRQYFDEKFFQISRGVIHIGKLEGYFNLFRQLVLPAVHDKLTVESLFQPKDASEQELFYNEQWNSPAYKFLSRLFFSSPVLSLIGREREFFKHAKDSLSAFVTDCVARHLASAEVFDNPYLSYILRGRYDGSLPHYLREENFETIKANLDKISLTRGSLADVLATLDDIDVYNVSDVFEYLDEKEASALTARMVKASSKGALVVYWNMLVDRLISNYHGEIKSQLALVETLPEQSGTFFYKRFLLDKIGEAA